MESLTVRDYTRLKNRMNRLYEWASVPLPGLVMYQLGIAAVCFVVVLFVGIIVSLLLSSSIAFLISFLVAAVAAFGGYLGSALVDVSQMSLQEQIMLLFDYTFVQPKTISGFEADKEPDVFHWIIQMWEPTTPEWFETYHAFCSHYAQKTESA